MQGVSSVLFLVFMLTAAWWDLRTRRIPNWLTVSGAGAGLALAVVADAAVMQALAGFGVALVVGFLLYAVRVLGAGDAKLLAAVGAWAGVARLPDAMLWMLAGGALLAVLWARRQRLLGASLLSTATMLGNMTAGRAPGRAWVGETAAGKLPYGLGLGVGAMAWWFWAGGVLP